MNYTLAKELKEAGFPLKECKAFDPLHATKFTTTTLPEDKDGRPHSDSIWHPYPTLSELIEAVGHEAVVDAVIRREIVMIDSPSVARLWLALNKK